MKEYLSIASGDLKAKVLTPGSPLYARNRFNHAGFVYEVSYKGVVFSTPESFEKGMGTGGVGLCSQYTLQEAELDAQKGEKYLRYGIGTMAREEEPITIASLSEFETYPIEIKEEADCLTFTSKMPKINGYCAEEIREVKLCGDTMTITATLKNTGDKPIHENEYNHNFVLIGDNMVGPKYKLDLGAVKDVALSDRSGSLVKIDGGVSWDGEPTTPFFNIFTDVKNDAGYSWKLTHEDSSASIMEIDDFSIQRLTVWGVRHCISAEVFHEFTIEPGQSHTWTRKWIFTA